MRTILCTILIFCVVSIHAQDYFIQEILTGLSSPVELAQSGDDRLFIVEKGGTVKIYQNMAILSTPFIDISDQVWNSGERGLLGMAFPPDFSTSQQFYLHYSDLNGDTKISRFTASGNTGDPNSEEVILTVAQPFSNHNGGKISFGSDGYLYIGLGDGGSAGDPQNNSQNLGSLLGKLLRIDVSTTPYTIPADNPFVGDTSVQDEIFAYGLRNPWKFSFDASNGDLWIADVGQNQIEEINKVADASGLNFGWRCYEGNDVYNSDNCGASSEYTFPVAVYNHQNGGCSITGGIVVPTNTSFTELVDQYIFGDYCSGDIGTINSSGQLEWILETDLNISCIELGVNNEVFILDFFTGRMMELNETMNTEEVSKVQFEIKINNPVKESIQIQSNLVMDRITIYNLHGKQVYSTTMESPSIRKEISSHFLSTGAYLMEIYNKELNISAFEKILVE